MMMADDTIAA